MKRGQVSLVVRPESDTGEQDLEVCSPALGSAGYLIAGRRLLVLPLLIFPKRESLFNKTDTAPVSTSSVSAAFRRIWKRE